MTIRTALAALALGAAACSAVPAAAATTPAIEAFNSAFASVNDYTYKLHSHETKGGQSQDRVYSYSFLKPHFAKTLIDSGDGKGSGGTWSGGDTVSGHQGGFLSGIHLNVGLHDSRAVSLRGYTIPDGLLQNIVARYTETKGTLKDESAPAGYELVVLKVADPAANDGISEMKLYLNKSTHMPYREVRYAGDKVVVDDSFTDIKINPGLKQSDF